MYKTIFRQDDLTINEVGEKLESQCSLFATKLLKEFSEYNPRELEQLLAHVMGYEVALVIHRKRGRSLEAPNQKSGSTACEINCSGGCPMCIDLSCTANCSGGCPTCDPEDHLSACVRKYKETSNCICKEIRAGESEIRAGRISISFTKRK